MEDARDEVRKQFLFDKNTENVIKMLDIKI